MKEGAICPKCSEKARPNVLYFDESYNEEYFKVESVKKLLVHMDVLVVIGTCLETTMSSKIVVETI